MEIESIKSFVQQFEVISPRHIEGTSQKIRLIAGGVFSALFTIFAVLGPVLGAPAVVPVLSVVVALSFVALALSAVIQKKAVQAEFAYRGSMTYEENELMLESCRPQTFDESPLESDFFSSWGDFKDHIKSYKVIDGSHIKGNYTFEIELKKEAQLLAGITLPAKTPVRVKYSRPERKLDFQLQFGQPVRFTPLGSEENAEHPQVESIQFVQWNALLKVSLPSVEPEGEQLVKELQVTQNGFKVWCRGEGEAFRVVAAAGKELSAREVQGLTLKLRELEKELV